MHSHVHVLVRVRPYASSPSRRVRVDSHYYRIHVECTTGTAKVPKRSICEDLPTWYWCKLFVRMLIVMYREVHISQYSPRRDKDSPTTLAPSILHAKKSRMANGRVTLLPCNSKALARSCNQNALHGVSGDEQIPILEPKVSKCSALRCSW